MKEKLKSFLHDDAVFYTVLLLLVALTSFGLGRQSVAPNSAGNTATVVQNTEITPLLPQNPAVVSEASNSPAVIASKSGSRYHLPTCPGAKQIKESNIIEFPSIQAAEAAGYTPAANCQF